ncbi:hypothetical protein IFR05_011595 [Cadophora sp. M221]|nr:hypothetical protein IFR05_011595 [Cadophora sp. M221]
MAVMDEILKQIEELATRSEEPVDFAMLQEKKPLNLSTLPYDIRHLIIKSLDMIDSACLGLTSKSFWAIHKKKTPRTNLRLGCGPGLQYLEYNSFADRLKLWMGPNLLYSYVLRRFVTHERYAVLKTILDEELKVLEDDLDFMLGMNRPKFLRPRV